VLRLPMPSDDCIERAFCDAEVCAQAWASAGAIAPEAVAIEERAADPAEAMRAIVALLGHRGLLGLAVPGLLGGTFDRVRSIALCLARERLGYASPLVELAFAMQGLGSYAITARGSDSLRAAWLPRIAAGEAIAAFALTEEGAGSDLSGIETSARADGDEYVLRGTKVFISNAGIADLYTLVAATAPPGSKRRLSAFAVPGDRAGLRARPMRVLGGHPIGTLELDDVRIPRDHRIGEEGDGLSVALAVLHKFRPTVGAAAVGMAQRALDESVAHAKGRRQFGAPLADLQAVQLALADMACDVESARLMVYRAAALADLVEQIEGGDADPKSAGAAENGSHAAIHRSRTARTASMAKLVATESAFRVIDRAVQLHGGRGVLEGGIVPRLYQDVRALRIYEGATDVQKLLIARELLK
jgi:acyl-CoA dehydrogenase